MSGEGQKSWTRYFHYANYLCRIVWMNVCVRFRRLFRLGCACGQPLELKESELSSLRAENAELKKSQMFAGLIMDAWLEGDCGSFEGYDIQEIGE